jgi:predicted aspartyl protease
MLLRILDGLLWVDVTVASNGQHLSFTDVVIDTGSASTVFDADWLEQIGVLPALDDIVQTVQGVGGEQLVFERAITVEVDGTQLDNFTVQVGSLNFGDFRLQGILGLDFLLATGAVLNMRSVTLTFEP